MAEPMDTSNVPGGSLFEGPQYLIESMPGGELRVDQTLLGEVAQLERELIIVSVAGLYRTGKSYLMNRLAGKSSGFSLGSTTVPVTKGIWIWVRVHPEYPDKYLVLLDTEGLGDPMKGNPTHDCHIFCLATLLSSVLIYNAMGVIDDTSLNKLNFISEMSQHIRTKQEGKAGEKPDEDFDYYFPHLIYVLRDFSLDCEIDGREVSTDEYLDHCLSLKADSTQNTQQTYNEVRRCIRRYFKNRKCFTFDRPGSRKQLKDLESQQDSDLSRDFIDEVTKFCQYIFMNSPTKKLENGQTINGRMWSVMIQSYMDAIHDGAVPCIENAVLAMATIENTRAVDETVALYRQTMSEVVTLPTPDDKTLSDLHEKTLKVAIKHFLDKAVFDNDTIYQEKANNKILEEYAQITTANKQASVSKCRDVLGRLEQPLIEGLKNGVYSKPGGHKEYLSVVEDILKRFSAEPGLGTQKEVISLDYKAQKLKEGEGIMAADLALTEKEKVAEVERQKAAEAEQRRAVAEKEREQVEQESRDRQSMHEENMRQMEQKSQEELVALQKHQESLLTSRMAEQERLLKEGFSSEVASLKQEITNLRNRPPPRRRRRKWYHF